MKRFLIIFSAMTLLFASCKESYTTYSDAEFLMFADTLKTYQVLQDGEYFSVPVVSTVVCDYDRTFAVEVVDNQSDAIEGVHYQIESNTILIKAGESSTSVNIKGIYENLDPEVRPTLTLSLVMADKLEMPLYGKQTKVVLQKSCPFDINTFSGWCLVTSLFLYDYSMTGLYQRLIYTEPHPTLPNTIICRNWLYDGYDITMGFDTENPANPLVVMDTDQIMSDTGTVFGIIHGDDKILVEESPLHESYFYTCGGYLALWAHIYVEDLGESFGTVGYYYHIMEWVSDEEADRLQREEGL